jgi:hypothetical protein
LKARPRQSWDRKRGRSVAKSMKQFVGDFFAKELDNYLHKTSLVADGLEKTH